MTRKSLSFRVFVSSTFSDLIAERDALQERVFPRLRQLCQQNGARFQTIDLRWGSATVGVPCRRESQLPREIRNENIPYQGEYE